MNRFRYGDLVRLRYSKQLYKIEGYQKKVEVTNGSMKSTVQYQLKNIQTDELLLKTIEDIIPEQIHIIDYLLDKYNDYRMLHIVLCDEEYLQKAKQVIEQLKQETSLYQS